MGFEKFHYKTRDELFETEKKLGIAIPYSEDASPLCASLKIGEKTLANRIAVQPMEGCDGTEKGAPGELTKRRYMRFASSGAALIWGEATAVVNEGRANPRQLFMTRENVDAFKRQNDSVREKCVKENGFEPFLVCQLTHSGRYSKPTGAPAPIIAYHCHTFEKDAPLPDSALASDDYITSLPERFGNAARLSQLAGYDAADIKCCHRYLLSELCSAYTRPGRFGGSFENRTRPYLDSVRAALAAVNGDFLIASRLNLYDGFAYPDGFGVKENGGEKPNLEESKRLVSILHRELGLCLLDFTIGNPYFNPHVNRPYDGGPYVPPEHPLKGVARMLDCIGEVRREFPELRVISSGHSYMRRFTPNVAAGAVRAGVSDIAGFGREAFAYEGFARDMLSGCFDAGKCCVACGKCTELMRAGTVAGCVVRDSGIYLPYYKKYVLKSESDIK